MPFPHTIHMGADIAASRCSLNSMVWPLPWDGIVGVFSTLTSAFSHPAKQYSAGRISCHTTPFDLMDRAISMVSLSLCDAPNRSGVTCRTHRVLELLPILEAGENQELARRTRFLAMAETFSHGRPKSTFVFRNSHIHKGAHTLVRTLHRCHGAVEKVTQRSPSRLNYHVRDLVASSAVLS